MAGTPVTTPEDNLIKSADLVRAREVEFTFMFRENLRKLMEALSITRRIQKQAGTNLKAYKAVGTLEDGVVEEGKIIPLSHYKTEPITFDEITLNKWRKATSAEAIIEKGYTQAVTMTTDRMLKDVQKGIRTKFFKFLASGTGQAAGDTFQETLAQAWGQLQILFEDDDFEAVYFMNPLDVADYLGSANISLQEAFGMTYVKDFLGLGTVIFNGSVPKGKIYATAKENIVLYYVPVNGADLNEAFTFTSDELGLIGIHEKPDYDNMTASDTVICGIVLFAERIDGIVVGTIGGTITPTIKLDKTTATIPVDGTVNLTATVSPAGTAVAWESSDESKATVNDGTVTGVAAGTVTITAKVGAGSAEKTATCTVTVSSGA